MSVTPYQLGLLLHTLGLSEHRRESYRNHFVAGEGHDDMPHLEALERVGLMERRPSPRFLDPGDIVFAATDAGREAAIAALPEPRKRSRYEEYLDADGSESFGEFLCGYRLPKIETRRDFLGNNREYRMYRNLDRWVRDVEGWWAPTMKEAKASYKTALKARRQM